MSPSLYCKSFGSVISQISIKSSVTWRYTQPLELCDFSFFLVPNCTSLEVVRLNALLNFVGERVFGWCEFYEQSDSYGQALTFETGLNLILIVLVVPVPVGI